MNEDDSFMGAEMQKVSKLMLGLMAFLFSAVGTPASAALTVSTNSTGLTNPTATITFSEVPLAAGASVTNQFASLGATFSNAYIIAPGTVYDEFSPTPALHNWNGTDPDGGFLSIMFNQAVTGVAFLFASGPGNAPYELYLGGTLIDSGTVYTTGTSLTRSYFNFTGVTFDRFLIAGGQNYMQLDNLQFTAAISAVPEPSAWAMMLLGFGAIGIAMRRRRKVATVALVA